MNLLLGLDRKKRPKVYRKRLKASRNCSSSSVAEGSIINALRESAYSAEPRASVWLPNAGEDDGTVSGERRRLARTSYSELTTKRISMIYLTVSRSVPSVSPRAFLYRHTFNARYV